jgi:hypothetical protein
LPPWDDVAVPPYSPPEVPLPQLRLSRAVVYLSLALPCLAAPLGAQAASQGDSAAVVRVAEDLLKAISTRDTALARKVMMPGAQLASIADPASATTSGRMQTDQQFIASLSSGTAKYLERMWSPTVFLQGPLAVVRAPYDFYNDGKFSHCGVDVFTLVKSRGAWVISHVVYTTQRTGCAESPLGPP